MGPDPFQVLIPELQDIVYAEGHGSANYLGSV